MPHVQSRNQVKRNGQHNRGDLAKVAPETRGRDDIDTAYAGDKNNGPAGKASKQGKQTNLKARRLRDSDKEPVGR